MCKACTGKQRKCAKQSTKSQKAYDAENDCPGNAPDQRSSAVLMEQQCGADFATLVDVIGVPSQHVAAVIVRSAIEPNSAAHWPDSSSSTPSCVQLLFFDTRRSVRELEQLIADVYYLNHTMTMSGMPTFTRIVPRAVAIEKCQCGRDYCRADEFRAAQAQRRAQIAPVRALLAQHSCSDAPQQQHILTPNVCWLASGDCDEDVTGVYLESDTLPLVPDTPQTRLPRVAALRNWHMYDTASNSPILPADSGDESDLNQQDFLCIGKTLYRALKFDAPLEEQTAPLLYDMPVDGVNSLLVNSAITLGSLNVEEVMRCRRASEHCTPICCKDAAKQMCVDLISCDYSVKEMVRDASDEARRCLSRKNADDNDDDDEQSGDDYADASDGSESGEEALTSDGRRCLPPVADPQCEQVLAKLAILDTILDGVSAATSAPPKHKGMSKSSATHEYGCACFIDAFLRKRCTKMIDITLVALPSHPVYRELGDSIFGVGSPMLRNLIVAHCMAQTKCADGGAAIPLSRGGAYVDAEIDMAAPRGTAQHVDSVLADRPDLRQTLEHFFGKFKCTELPPTRAGMRIVEFHGFENRQRQHAFGERVQRALNNSAPAVKRQPWWIGGVLGAQCPWHTYEEVLAASKAAFRAPPGIRSLAELAWHRGKMSDTQLWHKLADWMPGVIRKLLLVQADRPACNIEMMIRDMLELPQNEGRVISLATEKTIVEELLATRNWRVALARCVMATMGRVDCLLVYQHSLVTAACMVAIAYQLSELAWLERRGKLVERACAPTTTKKKEQEGEEKKQEQAASVHQKPEKKPAAKKSGAAKRQVEKKPPAPAAAAEPKREQKLSPPPAKKAKQSPQSPRTKQRGAVRTETLMLDTSWVTVGSKGRRLKKSADGTTESAPAYAVVQLEEEEQGAAIAQTLAPEAEQVATYSGDVLAIFEPLEPLFDITNVHEMRAADEYMCAASHQNIWQALPALPAFVW